MLLTDLKNFHSKFVNPKVRRLNLEVFSLFGNLPLELPHLKIAALKFIYCEGKLAHGFCLPPAVKTFKSLDSPSDGLSTSAVAEEYLRFFHVDCRTACQQLQLNMLTQFFGNVDKYMFAKLLISEPAARDEGLRECAHKYRERLVRWLPNNRIPVGTWREVPVEAAVLGAMQPKVIKYDDQGRPVTKQDEMTEECSEIFGWSSFMNTSCFENVLCETRMRTLILAQLHILHSSLPPLTENDLQLIKGGTCGGGVHVLAMKGMEAGSLRMALS